MRERKSIIILQNAKLLILLQFQIKSQRNVNFQKEHKSGIVNSI